MGHVTKQFTMIDFLGFLIPGAALAFTFQWYYGGIEAPFERFFGEGSPFLAVYFLALSYSLGILLHEAGRSLNLCFRDGKWQTPHWQDGTMAAAYKKIFDVSITAQNTSEQRLANRRIIEYIQGKNDPGKMRTFSAFAAMSRTLIVTLAIILWIIFINERTWFTWERFGLCGVIFAVLISNWRHYVKLRLEYAYTMFLSAARELG